MMLVVSAHAALLSLDVATGGTIAAGGGPLQEARSKQARFHTEGTEFTRSFTEENECASREAPDPFSVKLRCVPEGRDHLVGGSPTRAMVGWPGSWRAVRLGNWAYRSPATKAASGGRANRRAVTCVKPEQASKGKSWMPTRPEYGEGSTVRGSSRQMHLDWSTGVRGTARRDRGSRKRGRPVAGEGSGLNDAGWHRSTRESDRGVVCAGQRPDQEG